MLTWMLALACSGAPLSDTIAFTNDPCEAPPRNWESLGADAYARCSYAEDCAMGWCLPNLASPGADAYCAPVRRAQCDDGFLAAVIALEQPVVVDGTEVETSCRETLAPLCYATDANPVNCGGEGCATGEDCVSNQSCASGWCAIQLGVSQGICVEECGTTPCDNGTCRPLDEAGDEPTELCIPS